MGFSTEQQRTLAAVLDAIIPPAPERGLPGAGELGLAEQVDTALDGSPEQRLLIERGLELVDQHGAGDLAALDGELPGFVPSLVFHTYTAYYSHPRVQRALGLEARPPHPLGYEMEPNDLSLLDPVRERQKLYREP